MKHLLLVWLLLGLMEHAWSQNSTNSIFLFEKFTNAYVYYRDGRVFQVPINYDLFKEKFIFLDKDQAENEFSDPDMVVSVKIGERTFLAVGGGNMAELIQQEPRILVQYSGSKRIQKNLTYGGKTETAAVDSYSETQTVYSILRNHLYSVGKRNLDDPGSGTDPDPKPDEPTPDPTPDDDPESLNNKKVLTLIVNDNWEVIHDMELE